MKIGGHVSAAGGFLTVFDRAVAIGANCLQMFVSSPRVWKVGTVDSKTAQRFQEKLKTLDLAPSFVHIKYLVNLCSPNPETVIKSKQALAQELQVAAALGLAGGMFHIGALAGGERANGRAMVIQAIKDIMSQSSKNVLCILENSASLNKIGGTLEEVASMLEAINHPQVAACLDTAHAFAAGFDLRTEAGVEQFVTRIDATIGLEKVAVIHANDSKADLGSGRDLHENIGEGKIGLDGFKALLNHSKLKK